uniref:Uncharacterized protein n=1 Tax=Acrobeloides nanus TaxID=290746 RepID=A0A914CWQ5_9BILA
MGKINGKPLRDHYANQALGLAADYDCGVSSTEASKYNVTIDQWIVQPLDHFDTSINVNWSMRYEYKEKYFQKRNDSDIVFLLIGGEGSIPNNWICFENYTWTQLAIENKAFMFQTEHRYFGKSRPTKDMATENLKWLTMEQALADLNNFIVQMNSKFNFTNPRWVAFGGSYP